MDEKNKQLLDQILKYAAERKIQIPADIVLKLSTIYAEDLYSELKQGQASSETEGKILMGTLRKLVEQIILEEVPEFGLMNPGLVPAPGRSGLMLMSTGWKPYLMPSAPGGGGGGTGISDAPGDGQSYVRYNRTWIVMPPGVTQHSLLTGLDYASAGHTGFQPTLTGAATLALLLPVDGAGSLLDADLLDGNEAAAFQTALTFPLGADLGGTGIANAAASTLTLAAATSITGGGTLGLGGFTGAVPATGTFAMGAGTLSAATVNNVTGAAHTHAITASTELVGNGTSIGQVIISDEMGLGPPFQPGWSTFYLGGTTGGKTTFAVSNTKTLTLTATDTRNITFPITGTAAIGAGTLTAVTTNDVTVNGHTHAITASTALVAAGTAQYQVLTTGANPYPAGWSGFYLDGTTGGKTVFAVTNTKTLTLTSVDSYALTIPGTGTAALLDYANLGALNIRRTTNAFNTVSTYTAFVIGDLSGANASNGGLYAIGRYNKANSPFAALNGWDNTAERFLIFGGGGWDVPDATKIEFYTAPTYTETVNTGLLRLSIFRSGNIRIHGNNTTNVDPGYPLSICPSNGVIGFAYIDNSGSFHMQGNSGVFWMYTSTNTPILITTNNGSEKFRFKADSGFTITGAADTQQLLVKGYSTQAVATPLVQFTRNDAAAGISAMLGLTALGSGVNNDGGSILLNGKTSTTAATAMGLDQWYWVNATHASRTARRVFNVYDTAIREGLRIEASGTAPMIGFLGAAAVVRPLATADLGVALSDLGLRVAGTAYSITTSGAVSFTGGVTTSGGRVEGVTTYTDTCNILTTDECVIFNKATAFTATMPAATVGQRFYFKNIGAGNVTLSFPGTDTVDEVDDDLIMTQYDSYTLICRLANKWVKV